jgi:hypothetical protein
MSRIRTLVVAAALLGGCGSDALPPVTGPDAGAREEDLPPPEFFVEEPLGSDRWKSADALPDWVEHPPRRPGVTTFVLDSQSNLRHLAVGRSGDHDRRAIAMTVEAVLAGSSARRAPRRRARPPRRRSGWSPAPPARS